MASAAIFNIQRYSIHDGPGIRTTVFVKGCPLRCPWCCNPESQLCAPELLYDAALCTECGLCVSDCPQNACRREGGQIVTDRAACAGCTLCVCPSGAKRLAGQEMTAEEALRLVLRDAAFYRRSGGGVTLSGGEPLLYPDFSRELLQGCREKGVSTAMETTCCVPPETLESVLAWLDTVMVDLKLMDDRRHRALLGCGNAQILENIRLLARRETSLLVRIPIIPGLNDDEENLAASAAFLCGCGVGQVTLLPYHRMGEGKYARLGRTYTVTAEPPAPERMDVLLEFFRARGLHARLG